MEKTRKNTDSFKRIPVILTALVLLATTVVAATTFSSVLFAGKALEANPGALLVGVALALAAVVTVATVLTCVTKKDLNQWVGVAMGVMMTAAAGCAIVYRKQVNATLADPDLSALLKDAGQTPLFESLASGLMTLIVLLIISAVLVLLMQQPKFAEFVRRQVVSLKRDPKVIPMVMLAAAFLVYTLNLTHISNSTAKIQGSGMGLAQFATTLFSMLSLLCLLNSYPRRKKPNLVMLVALFVMLGVIVFCDVHYLNCINAAVTREASPIDVVANPFVQSAKDMLNLHIVCVALSALLAATLPLYSKLIKKINTTVQIEENEGMHAIEISE